MIRLVRARPVLAGLALAALLLATGPLSAQYYNQGFNSGFSNPGGSESSNSFSPGYYSGAPAYSAAGTTAPRSGQEASMAGGLSAAVTIKAPKGAQVWFAGVKATKEGPQHKFRALTPDRDQSYRFTARARWTDADGKEVNVTKVVRLQAGQRKVVTLEDQN